MPAVDQKPRLAYDDVRPWLEEHYGIAGTIEPLPGERDLNLKLTTTDLDVGVSGRVVVSAHGGNEDLHSCALSDQLPDAIKRSL